MYSGLNAIIFIQLYKEILMLNSAVGFIYKDKYPVSTISTLLGSIINSFLYCFDKYFSSFYMQSFTILKEEGD